MEQQDNSMEQQQDTAQSALAEPRIDVGAVLREARESAGISVEEVAGRIKFAPRQIEALEAGDFSQLPEMAFIRGFVRSYARLMQLDDKALLDALPGAPARAAVATTAEASVVPRRGADRNKQNLFWLGGAVVLVAVVIIAWKYDAGETVPQEKQVSQPSEVAGNQASSVAAASAPAAAVSAVSGASVGTSATAGKPAQAAKPVLVVPPKPAHRTPPKRPERAVRQAPAPAPKAHPAESGKATTEKQPAAAVSGTPQSALQAGSAAIFHAGPKAMSGAASSVPASQGASHPVAASRVLHIQFDGDSWLEVRDGTGHVLLSMMGKQGSSRTVSGPPPLHVVVGNANVVKLRYRGKPVELVPSGGSNVVRLKLE